MTDLKLLIVGTGAVGTYIGSSLLLSGQQVVFLDRPGMAEKITSGGMKLVIDGQTHQIEQPIISESVTNALQHGPFDAVLTAVKSFETAALGEELAKYKVKLPPVLCLQNGVENEGILEEHLGEGRVIAGTLTSAISKPAPGTAVLERLRGIGVADDHEISQKIVESFNQAGLHASLYPDAGSMKWSKLLTNLLANASSAILDMSPSEIFNHPGLYEMESQQIREALEVMHRMDNHVVDLPGTPVRLLALLMQVFPVWAGRRVASRVLGKGRGNKMPSFHIDLWGGRRKSEVDFLNGAVVRFGEKFGVLTPVNRVLTDTLRQLTEGNLPLDAYKQKPEKLLSQLK